MKKILMFTLLFSVLGLENNALAQTSPQSLNRNVVVNFVNTSSGTDNPMIVTYATNNASTDVFCSGSCDILEQNGRLTFTAAKGNPSEGIIQFIYRDYVSCVTTITYLIKGSINEPIRVFDATQVITPNTVSTKRECLRQ